MKNTDLRLNYAKAKLCKIRLCQKKLSQGSIMPKLNYGEPNSVQLKSAKLSQLNSVQLNCEKLNPGRTYQAYARRLKKGVADRHPLL